MRITSKKPRPELYCPHCGKRGECFSIPNTNYDPENPEDFDVYVAVDDHSSVDWYCDVIDIKCEACGDEFMIDPFRVGEGD
jgi:ribosomal protein S27E